MYAEERRKNLQAVERTKRKKLLVVERHSFVQCHPINEVFTLLGHAVWTFDIITNDHESSSHDLFLTIAKE